MKPFLFLSVACLLLSSHLGLCERSSAADDLNQNDEAKQAADEIKRNNARIQAELLQATELRCSGIALIDGLTYVGDLHRIKIEFDDAAKERVRETQNKTMSLSLKGELLEDVLMHMLHPFGLSYFVDDGKLIVSTGAEIRQRGMEPPVNFGELQLKLSKYPDIPWEFLLQGHEQQVDSRAVTQLKLALADEDAQVRRQAAITLTRVARQVSASSALAALKQAVKSGDAKLRRDVYRALAAIGHEDLTTLPMLIEAWSRDEVLRDCWIIVIREFDDRVYEELENIYLTSSPELRSALIQSALGREAAAQSLLLLGLNDIDEDMRRRSLYLSRGLFESTVLTGEFIEALVPFLERNNARDRQFVEDALDADAKKSLLPFLRILNESSPEARRGALATFKSFSHRETRAVERNTIEQLSHVLDNESTDLRYAAMLALATLQAPSPGRSRDISWGLEADGLQTSLNVVTTDLKVGDTASIELRVRNASKSDLNSDKLPNSLNGWLRFVNPGSNEIRLMDLKLEHKSVRKLERKFDILIFNADIEVTQSGQFLFQFLGNDVPRSNVVEINVTE